MSEAVTTVPALHAAQEQPPVKRSRFTYPITSSGSQTYPTPLDDPSIVAALLKIVGIATPVTGRFTGFFLEESGRAVFVSTSHAASNLAPKVTSGSLTCDIDYVVCDDPDRRLLGDEHDIQLYDGYTATEQHFESIPLIPEDHVVKVGDEVYFVGYPLPPSLTPVFNKGYISSIYRKSGNINGYTIAGNIIAGYSGCPVVIKSQDAKSLLLLGMIHSQGIALKQELTYLDTHSDSQVRDIGNILKHNLSTGIIHATDLRICRMLLGSAPIPRESELFEAQPETLPTVHGTLQNTQQPHKREKMISRDDIKAVVGFLNDQQQGRADLKKSFYSLMWKNSGTLYTIGGGSRIRLDAQKPTPQNKFANLQIQVDSRTVATVLVDCFLAFYDKQDRIAEVVNYVLQRFKEAFHHFTSNVDSNGDGQTLIITIKPI